MAQPRPKLPPGVKAFWDIPYVENGHERQVLDIYLPEQKPAAPLPVILNIHAGGWQSGDKADGIPPLGQGYVARGYAIASMNYRLSQHAPFPAQIEDCKAAVRWLRAHAADYELDPHRFVAMGDSAGAHLCALLGTSGGVKKFDVGAHREQSSRVQLVVEMCAPTDIARLVEAHNGNGSSAAESLIGGPLADHRAAAIAANPIAHLGPDAPPFLIQHGDADLTVPYEQSVLLFEALKQAGCAVHFHTIRGGGHQDFWDRPTVAMRAEFIDRWMKGSQHRVAEPPATTSECGLSEIRAGAAN